MCVPMIDAGEIVSEVPDVINDALSQLIWHIANVQRIWLLPHDFETGGSELGVYQSIFGDCAPWPIQAKTVLQVLEHEF